LHLELTWQASSPVFLETITNVAYDGLALSAGLAGQHPIGQLLGPFFGPTNYAGFADPTYRELAEAVIVETRPDAQRALYTQPNDMLLDQSWVRPIAQSPQRIAASTRVQGLRYDLHDALARPDVCLTS
jgi:ABC-type transport system substrate-binding protein